ncbi:formate dehydrogenase accessory sulfurtransferase FdhD [Staphylococcus saccharolyticus]|uniref:Sulfur carrier protein FdhD n=1 Tax=Staphylococcus saccharolyticus TaxID=33028 RepID=A0A380GZT5_9STAP|nr:formate dehydrogenase accessory sulfurtransferase FdhD [Staphylococcus saccharolyticus]MBL7564872.1 formate dehydrogenase accessory sulfurtransferase FdhD [Staphylococcus saccharolyticus]MBL7570864.1 formate dehydrogenase accessory sulfurtransferase FdhD [Staphylococcus saccharolyticus]QQB98727.1 formate dehydrogenase accessory sulfurtransferase FdhD [Staphylococcus saccharolyticus]QRJ67058.1 formate dehydrogenase accessory sulfurtransferase FdhD [Staphylococcus saccharolyticus]RTX97001.1 f
MGKDVSKEQIIVKYENGKLSQTTDQYATEFPLTIRVNGNEFATIICSPNHLEELVLGFLASEGVISKIDELESIQIDDSKGGAHVELTHQLGNFFDYSTKRMIASCCGKNREFYFQNDAVIAKTSMTHIELLPNQVLNMMTQLQGASNIFKQTGGLHNAAISDCNDFFEHRQDIGRHNALDKLYGYCIQRHIPVRDKALIFSGRISSEILIKAAKIGVGVILSKSAPTSLAVKLAQDLNITAIGFIRNRKFNIYSHPERIKNL